ncbi:cuticular protein RR-1 motif 36 [Aphomia sociella]
MIIFRTIFAIVLFMSDVIYANGNNTKRHLREINDDSKSVFIPVAVVTEETHHDKVIDSTVSNILNIEPFEKTTITNKDQKVLKLSKDFTVKSIEVESGKQIGNDQPLKIGINADLEIPVAVVYDEPTTPNNIRKISRRRKITNNGQKLNQRRLNNATLQNETISLENKHDQRSNTSTSQLTTKKPEITSVLPNSSVKEAKKKRTRERDPVVPIIESENQVYSHNGVFHYSYEGGDGTKAFENGELKSFDNEKTGEAVVGGFSYMGKDGQEYSLSYTADENGYRPVGAHLPTPPPIPPAIERALRYLATKSTPEPVTDSIDK